MKKTIFKAAACVAAGGLLLLCMILLFRVCVSRRIDCRTTLIAAREIAPRTRITEEDILEVEIPEQYLLDGTCSTKQEVIGMYTDIQGKIPAGSPFYRSMIYDSAFLPDHPQLQLKEGQSCFSAETDVSSLGSLSSGMRCDVHVSIDRRDEPPLTGCLLEGVRILSVKDYQGLEITDDASTGIPYLAELAVDRSDVDLLNLAESEGKLRFFTAENAYSTAQEATLCKDSKVTVYLQTLLERAENASSKERGDETVKPGTSENSE